MTTEQKLVNLLRIICLTMLINGSPEFSRWIAGKVNSILPDIRFTETLDVH